MSLQFVEEMLALCERRSHERFERAIADKSPIERLILRRVRERLLSIERREQDVREQAVQHGDGSGRKPAGVIHAKGMRNAITFKRSNIPK